MATKSVSISIAGIRMSVSAEGLDAISDAMEVGADGFGMGHGSEEAENEAREIIGHFKSARDALKNAGEPTAYAKFEETGDERLRTVM